MSCKVCNGLDQVEIDRHLSQGESSRVIARWTDEIGRPVSHTSIAQHRKHAVDPEQAAMEEHRNGTKITLPTVRVSSGDFLEAVVQIGARQIEENPSRVKIDHALRAATALERKREDGKGGMRVLVLALTGHTDPVTIRGTYKQLEGSE